MLFLLYFHSVLSLFVSHVAFQSLNVCLAIMTADAMRWGGTDSNRSKKIDCRSRPAAARLVRQQQSSPSAACLISVMKFVLTVPVLSL